MNFTWQGASGRWYDFEIVRAKRDWADIGGLYMFVKPGDYPTMEAGGPVCLFLAKTASFAQSLARHEMWTAAQHLGAAEIHLLAIADERLRAQVERDLLEAQMPILNRQMRRAA